MKKLILVSLIVLSGCQQSGPTKVKGIIDNMVFFKHPSGLCFAAVNSDTNLGYEVTSITEVDCNKVQNYIIESK